MRRAIGIVLVVSMLAVALAFGSLAESERRVAVSPTTRRVRVMVDVIQPGVPGPPLALATGWYEWDVQANPHLPCVVFDIAAQALDDRADPVVTVARR